MFNLADQSVDTNFKHDFAYLEFKRYMKTNICIHNERLILII